MILKTKRRIKKDHLVIKKKKFEPNCTIVMQKCFGELLAILIYLIMIVLFLIGSVQLALNGKPWVPVLEFLIAYAID